MKYFNQFTGFSALLLAGTMGFAACSSDDEVADVNPSYDGSSVKAQFSINIPANATQSRMTSGEAQEGTDAFLGMKNIKLFPLILTGTEEVKDKKPVVTTLGDIDAGNNSWTRPSLHAKVYNDVQFDLGVNHAVFYGEAKHGTTEMSLTPNYPQSTQSKFDDITFTLASSGSIDVDKQNKLLEILNGVDEALTTNEKRGDVEIQGIKTLHQAYRANTGTAQVPYKVIAGSSAKIKAMMTDLYNSCETGKTNNAEYATEYGNIQDTIKTYFNFTENNGSLEYRSGYPSDYPTGIPNGAVAVQFNGSKFAYTTSDINSGSNFNMTTADKYCKPSSLYYFADTEIRTLNEEWLKTNLSSKNLWSEVVAAYDDGDKSVTPSTQSIILRDQVQYGVAALKTVVKLAADNTNFKLTDSRNKTYQVYQNSTNKLKVTGVLVGGQPLSVKWNFVPAAKDNYVVYDGIYTNVNGVGITDNTPNYTLLLQNQDLTTTAEKVKVAIEFENDMEDFYGHDDMLISKGTKFYLIADLDPAAKTQQSGAAQCVFQQDYMTSATFTVTSLKNAYSVVPDLRSPKLEFGLSVDLSWQAGMDFEVSIGGDN